MEVDHLGRKWLADGELGKDEAEAVRTAVEKLAAMYRRHIEFEDSVLFPLANPVFGAAQATEIAAEMAKRQNLDI